eukprot:CAMPEP_0114978464 /NCGR_PEP_ID=MMETSP0216-20121206/3820_1 /TAXON_ID=223996 /ORGANISM="Protocruzia adherens, Strain Boccale" /LENGTH=115 /DNA_ID=CAMNT_0002339661 /DNA_START=51 /DNA_END=398 /DNA_ORIENTATION=-
MSDKITTQGGAARDSVQKLINNALVRDATSRARRRINTRGLAFSQLLVICPAVLYVGYHTILGKYMQYHSNGGEYLNMKWDLSVRERTRPEIYHRDQNAEIRLLENMKQFKETQK